MALWLSLLFFANFRLLATAVSSLNQCQAACQPHVCEPSRRRPKLVEILPEPGPGEYTPGDSTLLHAPAYTLRDKLARELDPPPYPGPGHYDVEESTIGNWGAGMAAHVPEKQNVFLRERIEVFRRGAAEVTDREFLRSNREVLLRMREEGLRGGSAGARPVGAGGGGRRKARSAGQGRTKGRSGTADSVDAAPQAFALGT